MADLAGPPILQTADLVTEGRPGRRFGTGQLGILLGMPVLCALILGGWVWWRATASLDAIELRSLAWSNIATLTWEHIVLTVVATIIVVLAGVPAGIALTRPRLKAAAAPVVAVANTGQAAPTIGIIVLLAMWLGFGFWTAVAALAVSAFLPVLRNTIVGLQGVDPTLIEAARGMGMSQSGVLWRVEMPLAIPVIMSGVRTALILVVGTAAFGTFINAGGLGHLIVTGISLFRTPILVSGALIMAVLAVLVDWAGRLIELAVTPKGM